MVILRSPQGAPVHVRMVSSVACYGGAGSLIHGFAHPHLERGGRGRTRVWTTKLAERLVGRMMAWNASALPGGLSVQAILKEGVHSTSS